MTTLTCDDCQATVPRLSSQQKRCRSCGVEAERDRRRPGLAALADLCDAQMTSWTWEDVTP